MCINPRERIQKSFENFLKDSGTTLPLRFVFPIWSGAQNLILQPTTGIRAGLDAFIHILYVGIVALIDSYLFDVDWMNDEWIEYMDECMAGLIGLGIYQVIFEFLDMLWAKFGA